MTKLSLTGIELLTVKEVAELLGVRSFYVYTLLWDKRLPGAKKKDGVWQIPASAVEHRLAEVSK